MPWLEVNGNASLALAASLVDVSGSVVEDAKHGNDTVGSSIGSSNVGLAGTNVVAGKTNSPGILGNDGTVLEGVVDSVDGVILHGQEEARRHLRSVGSGIEQGGCGVGEVTLGEAFVGLEDAVNIVSVDSDGDTHKHALWAFCNLSVHLEKVGLFQCLEAKVIVFEITGVVDGLVKNVLVLHDSLVVFLGNKRTGLIGDWVDVVVKFGGELGESFNGRFLEVGNGNSSSKNGIIGMLGGERCGSLGGKSIEKGEKGESDGQQYANRESILKTVKMAS